MRKQAGDEQSQVGSASIQRALAPSNESHRDSRTFAPVGERPALRASHLNLRSYLRPRASSGQVELEGAARLSARQPGRACLPPRQLTPSGRNNGPRSRPPAGASEGRWLDHSSPSIRFLAAGAHNGSRAPPAQCERASRSLPAPSHKRASSRRRLANSFSTSSPGRAVGMKRRTTMARRHHQSSWRTEVWLALEWELAVLPLACEMSSEAPDVRPELAAARRAQRPAALLCCAALDSRKARRDLLTRRASCGKMRKVSSDRAGRP